MVELLQELRMAQTGVQILFGFLLALSFTERFGRIDAVKMSIYVATLLLSVVTAGLLVRIAHRPGPYPGRHGRSLLASGAAATR